MKRWLAPLLALAALATLAACSPTAAPPVATLAEVQAMGPFGVMPLTPPARYAAAGLALEQRGRIDYVFVSPEEARQACNGSGACVWRRIDNSCRVTISTAYTGEFLVAMIAHERAHCGGWPASHPAA